MIISNKPNTKIKFPNLQFISKEPAEIDRLVLGRSLYRATDVDGKISIDVLNPTDRKWIPISTKDAAISHCQTRGHRFRAWLLKHCPDLLGETK